MRRLIRRLCGRRTSLRKIEVGSPLEVQDRMVRRWCLGAEFLLLVWARWVSGI